VQVYRFQAEGLLAPMRSSPRPPPAINILPFHSGGSPSAMHLNAFSEALTSPAPSPALRARGEC
jgi:hypothetical protein